MKILHSVFTKGWGGLEKYPLTLVDEFKIRAHEIIIVTIEGTKLHEEALKRGIKVYTIKEFKKFSFAIIKELKRIVKLEKVDIIHMNSSRELYNWFFVLKKFKKIKAFLTFHIGVPKHKSFLHKILYDRISGVFVISTRDRNKMVKDMAIEKNKIHLVFNGVDLNKFNSNIESTIRAELGLEEKDILIIAVGNLSSNKGILEFLAVGERIVKEYENVCFAWVGDDAHIGDTYTLESLKDELENKNLNEKVKLLGYRTDVAQILKGSDLFVLPSHDEAFGIVYIEAMAMGLPVIGCNSGGVPDIIKEGTGFMCEPKNPYSLYVIIKKALKEDLAEIGKNNKTYVKMFAMDKYADKIIKTYMGEKWEKN